MSKPENQKEIENKIILVYYISVTNIPENEIPHYLEEVSRRISLSKDSIPNFGAALTVPTFGETRIECINPIYINNDDLIKKHERLMAELHESMIQFINNNKNKTTENE